MSKVKIDLAGHMQEVDAYLVAGGLAITRRIGADWKPSPFFTVTHLATGKKIVEAPLTLTEARRWIRRLLAIRPDWTNVSENRCKGLKKKVERLSRE